MFKKIIASFVFFLCIVQYTQAQNDSIGVYYETNNSIEQIEPIRYFQTKSNTLGSALTMGIAGSKLKTVYKGSSSKNRVDNTPTFYFYYSRNIPIDKIEKYYMFYSSTTPNDILLAQFKSKKKTRELQVGKVNIYSGFTLGTADDLDILINVDKVKDGVYKITFDKPLDKGEYCFLFNGPNGSGAYMSVFDFSVE